MWALLLVLVVVPLSTVTGFAVSLTGHADADAQASADATGHVRSFSFLARAAAAVDQEVLVILGASLAGPGGAVSEDGTFGSLVERTREQTDEWLTSAADLTDAADVAHLVQAEMTALRVRVDSGVRLGLTEVQARYSIMTGHLRERQGVEVAEAADAATNSSTVAAIRDARLVADVAGTLGPDVVGYLQWQLDPGVGTSAHELGAWLESNAAAASARDGLSSVSDQGGRAAANTLAGTDAARLMARILSPSTVEGPAPTRAELEALVGAAVDQSALVATALDDVVTRARIAAADDGAAAEGERDRTLLVTLAAAAVTVGIVWLVGRHLSSSLRQLSVQADEVSEGRLVDVGATGPREVRSVGRALGSAVAGLRRVQDQARAVARGDLTDPVLDEAVPGPLGEALHASVEQLVGSLRQRDRLQAELGHQAAHDPLTDLPNRARALELTTASLHRARRSGAATGVLFVDLDGFKGVNDRAGHAAGDDVLRTVASRMRAVARAGDSVCRLGGDEFVVLVEAVGDIAELVALGERLVAEVSLPMTVVTDTGPRQVAVGASIGVAMTQDGEVDGDGLLAQADAAVYRAKHSGRGRVEVFDDRLRAQIDGRRDIEEALRRGLTDGDVHVVYQPVLDVAAGHLIGFEALARWERRDVGLLMPDAFVPVAEQSNLICELDHWVLRAAVEHLGRWRAAAGLNASDIGPTVSVNLSARTLCDPGITEAVLDLLGWARVPSRSLVLEVTEPAVHHNPALLTQLTSLRAHGVSIALDDFGTGVTSIGALRHLPIDTIKVHGSFLSSDSADRRLVALMVATAHANDLTVVAEGVEDAAALGRLADEDCDAAQGYHLSVPLPAVGAAALFHEAVAAAISR